MSRKANMISKEELSRKIRAIGIYDKLRSLEDTKDLEELEPYEEDEIPFINELLRNCSKLRKDLSKILFETENCMYDYDGLSGLHTLDNGLTFLGFVAGGDWELPVFSIVYWDGKDLRGYTPLSGNIFNPVSKTAFGSEEEREYGTEQSQLPLSNKEISKIKKVLTEARSSETQKIAKEISVLATEYDRYRAYSRIKILFNEVDFNWDRIESDIRNRIEVVK